MKEKYKWALCWCLVCDTEHEDLVPRETRTKGKRGGQLVVRQICDTCYCRALPERAAADYRVWKESVAP